jgi:hypothetical protein
VSRLSNRQFEAALATADDLFTAKPCGCLVLVMYDIPEVIRDSRDDILRESLAGRALQRCARGALPPLNCAEHRRVGEPAPTPEPAP